VLAEHQREAVATAIATLQARGGVLLADDVGLGKSFVAAEVMRLAQQEGSDVDLVIPAGLQRQWRETLSAFGVDARLLTHDSVATLPFVPLPRRRLVVVDEAHAYRNPRTRRYAGLARRTVGARVLLVTATPVCNTVADLEALLRLIVADDQLADLGVPSIDVAFATLDREALSAIVATLVIRRERSVLGEALWFGELERRVLRHPIYRGDGEVARLIESLRFPLVGDHAILRRFLWRRLESSEAALLESLRRQLRFYERVLTCIAAGRTLAKRDYRRAFGHEEDRDAFQQVLFWELFAPAGAADAQAVRDEVARLEALAECVTHSPRTKLRLLVDLVREERQPMLIFTGAAATAHELFDALREVRPCGVITARERSLDAVLHAFTRGHLDVVISTDLASEGLNLQRAGVVVHYDIPWNPVKLDQRNGRAHRIGQMRPAVRAIYFLPESDETRIVATIAGKNRARRRVLRAVPPLPSTLATMRPRLGADAAVVRFADAAQRAGLAVPPELWRRHKVGVEQLLGEMATEQLDVRRVGELVALVGCDSPAGAR
jgi:superfamily II DNA or RNA helicase